MLAVVELVNTLGCGPSMVKHLRVQVPSVNPNAWLLVEWLYLDLKILDSVNLFYIISKIFSEDE